jgi:hypothetical protein
MNTEKPQSDASSLDDDYFIKNAISCWLHHFPDHKWAPIYRDMKNRNYSTPKEPPIATPRTRTKRKAG